VSRHSHPITRDPADGSGTGRRRVGRFTPAQRPRVGAGGEAALDAAVRRVLRRREDWVPEALNDEEAESQLDWVRRTVIEGADAKELENWSASARTLTRRLLDLLRQDLLEHDDKADPAQLLEVIRSMESLRTHLAPPQQQMLATRLMGANASDLVVELAHDLRSPLTSIMFLAETLRRGQSGQVNDVQRQQLGIVYSAALSLTNIASDLIDLGREETFLTADAAARTPMSLREVCDSVRAMVAPMAEEKRLDILTLTPDFDLRLGNAVSLGRVLLNLTTNAIKFTESGYVEIVAQEHGPHRVEFSVRDTGRGMDAETMDRLYEPFHRSQSRTGFHFSDTGLGLTICCRLVQLMGGKLEVETRAGWGSRFFFEIDMPRGTRV
jgi:signal transduction histidine kinase